MYRKFTPVLDQLLPGLVLLALGIVLLSFKTSFLTLVLFLVGLIVLVSGGTMLAALLLHWKDRGGRRYTLGGALVTTAIGIVMLVWTEFPVLLLGLLFAGYVLVNAAAKLVNFILYVKNKVKGRMTDLFDCIFFLTFGILLLFTPLLSMDSILIIIGIYSILLGSFNLLEFVRSMLPQHVHRKIRRRVRISLPVFLVAFFPRHMLTRVNQYFTENADSIEDPEQVTEYKEEAMEEIPDIEIYIHISEGGSGSMGHCDFYFDGHVISYGNYDEYSRKLFDGTGDGVLFYTTKEAYLPFVIRYSRKTLFGFGLKLTDEQKELVRERLRQITEPLYPWKSPWQQDNEKGCAKPLEYYPDYASQLYRYTGAEFYKFRTGKFKSYFVLSTNCVQLVDAVFSSAGTAIVKLNGIVTPGTYYDYLNAEFNKPGTMVVTRTVYAEDPDDDHGVPRETDVRARYKEILEAEKREIGIQEVGSK